MPPDWDKGADWPTSVALAVAILLVMAGCAMGAEPEPRIPCWAVKAAVAAHGEEGAIKQARARGASERQIQEARRCLRQ